MILGSWNLFKMKYLLGSDCSLELITKSLGKDYSDTIEILSIFCKNKDLFNETDIYREILSKREEIANVIKEMDENKVLRGKIKATFDEVISKDKHHRYSQEDINIARKYFDAQ